MKQIRWIIADFWIRDNPLNPPNQRSIYVIGEIMPNGHQISVLENGDFDGY